MKPSNRLSKGALLALAVAWSVTTLNPAARAQGNFQEFHEPRHPSGSGLLVDFCAFPGVECGLSAALRFCQAAGFPNVVGFQGPINQPAPTQRMGDGQVCRSPGQSCSFFSSITCERGHAGTPPPQPQPYPQPQPNPQPQPQPQPATRVFDNPGIAGLPIDICVSRKSQCAGEAATLFCQQQGFQYAQSYTHAIFPTTARISGGQCVPELFLVCGGYTQITCAN